MNHEKIIDTSPLKRNVTAYQMLRELKTASGAWRVGVFTILLIAAVGGILLAVGTIVVLSGGFISGFFWMGGFFIIVSFVGSKDIILETAKNVKVRAFAEANELVFSSDNIAIDYPGSFFSTGSVRIADSLRSSELHYFEVGNFRLTAAGQDRSNSAKLYGYIRLKLPRQLPHMLLLSRVAKKSLPAIPIALDQHQRLSLEGDFDTVFTLYAPKAYERDALYIFTPDVMAKFMDIFGAFSIEIIEDEIYLYSAMKIDLTKPSGISAAVEVVNELNAKFVRRASRYSDEKVESLESLSTARISISYRAQGKNSIGKSGQLLGGSQFQRLLPIVVAVILSGAGIYGLYVILHGAVQHAADPSGPTYRTVAVILIALAASLFIGLIRVMMNRRTIRKKRNL